MTVRYYSSTAQETTLQVGINNSATVIMVAATTGFPVSFPYTLAIDYESGVEELVDVTAAAGLSLTVTRAVDSTSAAAHSAGARVRHVSSARDYRDSRDHENSTSGVHGLAPGVNVVGDTTVQTLTNKTLTSPVVNSGTLNGTYGGNPTFSGTVTMTNPSITNAQLSGTITGSPTFSGNPVFSGTPDFTNSLDWGGATVSGAGILTGGNEFRVTQFWRNPGNAIEFSIGPNGNMAWGDGVGAQDTFLTRNAVATLRVANNLAVANNLTVGGIGQVQAIRKPSATSRASTITATIDPHLTTNVVNGGTYIFQCWAMVNSNAASAGFAATFGGTSTGTLAWSGAGSHNSITTGSQSDGEWIARDNVTTVTPYGTSTTGGVFLGAFMTGTFVCSGDGTFGLQWAQRVSSATATILEDGSYIRVERIA